MKPGKTITDGKLAFSQFVSIGGNKQEALCTPAGQGKD